jgi:opacity protein-like surface antigen
MALAGAALAEPPPPPTLTFTSPAFNWSGVYGGLQIGGAWGYDDAFLFVPDNEILSEYDANLGGVKGDQSIFRAHHDLEENMVQVGFSYMINTSK